MADTITADERALIDAWLAKHEPTRSAPDDDEERRPEGPEWSVYMTGRQHAWRKQQRLAMAIRQKLRLVAADAETMSLRRRHRANEALAALQQSGLMR